MSHKLSEVSLMQLKEESAEDNAARFVIEPLSPGFGLTVGNSLRRVLLSSLPGAAITSIRIDGVSHEFSTVKGMVEDVVDLILNLKQIRFKMDSAEPQVIVLDVKGPKKVTAGDFKCPTGISVISKNLPVAELTQGGKLLLEATVERGRGYVPTEQRKEEKLPIGVIAIDAAFSPVRKVNFQTENTRVGKMTNFDRLVVEIETDGSTSPQEALQQSADILVDHFSVLSGGYEAPAAEKADEDSAADTEDAPAEKPKATKAKKAEKDAASAKTKATKAK